MRVVVATGIFPPDIGGPATHASDLARVLRDRGHDVVVLSLTDGARRTDANLVLYPRRWPWPVRTVAVTVWLVRHRRRYDVLYATGLDLPAVAGGRLGRRPVALKVPGDRAWERGRRQGLTDAGFDDFQDQVGGPARLRAMRAARNWAARNASVLVVPSHYMAGVVERWAGGRTPVTVVANGVSAPDPAAGEPTAPPPVGPPSAAPGLGRGLGLVFVGRLVAHKRIDRLLEALTLTDPSVVLDIVGDGPERERLEARSTALGLGSRVRFTGTLEHPEVMRRLAAADALVSATSYEGLPHVVIEALACGTPVVSTPAGGVVEAVVDGVNGLLVDPPDPEAFAPLFERLRLDPGLRERRSAGARESGQAWGFDRCATEVEKVLSAISARRPRAVYIGRGTVRWPASDAQRRKFAIHARYLRQLSIGSGPVGLRSVEGVRALFLPRLPAPAGAALYYAVAPVVAVAAAVGRRPGVVVCQSPFEALGVVVARALVPRTLRPLLQVELHGDWRTASRMYGSRARRWIAPVADRAAPWALRRADRVRTVSVVLEEEARAAGFDGPLDRHVTYSEFDAFLTTPPAPVPERPVATFVGVLERYKAVDVLLDAWPAVVARVPDAELVLVGAGSLGPEVERRLAAEAIPSVRTLEPMPQADLAALLDRSTCLVLPSRSEGLPRIVVEAMARGRAVVASDVGGMRELVDRSTGRLVPPEDVLALVDALAEVLGDRARAEAMGRAARERAESRQPAEEYEAGIARLAAWVRDGGGRDRP